MRKRRFIGTNGMTLIADEAGPETGAPILLLHGGGQTRGSWKNAVTRLAAEGYLVIAPDTRGHGESDWATDADYTLEALVGDVRAIVNTLSAKPALVGASLGGVTALSLLGEDQAPDVRALVLVDTAPRIDMEGAKKITAFMSANTDGFASVEDAADAVAAYNPNRPRPKDVSGLRRNLRQVDGRLYWHWDPAFMGARRVEAGVSRPRLESAAKRVRVPTLLVRGALSDLVGDEQVEHFRSLMPQASFVDVAGAGHMVAGDHNDAFNDAILSFLLQVDGRA